MTARGGLVGGLSRGLPPVVVETARVDGSYRWEERKGEGKLNGAARTTPGSPGPAFPRVSPLSGTLALVPLLCFFASSVVPDTPLLLGPLKSNFGGG
jgi:hypothetical protein